MTREIRSLNTMSTSDITRSEIETERENFRNLFRQTPEMVCILSGPDHLFEFVNEAHIKVLGFDATGMTVREAQPESVEVHGILDEVYLTGKTAELVEIPVTVTDRLRYFNLTYAARHDSKGQVNGVMILGIEITDQVLARQNLLKAIDASTAANEAKSRFLANISHEIRTPLSAIIGFSELIQPILENSKEGKSYLERISRNAAQLSRLIDELLDLSKIEAEKLEIEQVAIDINKIMEDVFSTMELRAREKSIDLRLRWQSERPGCLVTDPLRFSQILTNIIGNAIKFTETGGVLVQLETQENILSVRVSDSGIGLDTEQQQRIFEPFVQADSSVSRKYGGTGLGLPLSKKLAQLLGGDLILEKSVPGKGTVFRIDIKINGPATQVKPALIQESAIEANALSGKKILVVDDSEDNRTIANLFLQTAGAHCVEATNGEEAIQLVQQECFDIVLMDLQMPILDGYQAMYQLKKMHFQKPVIALTAHALKAEKDHCIQAGFSQYLTKPVDRGHLIRTIIELVSR